MRGIAWVVGNFAVMLCIVAALIHTGLIIRRAAWENATQIHFKISLNNAIKWGHYTNKIGILKVYPQIVEDNGDDLNQEPGDGRLALDYPPLRLLIISKWEAWTEAHFPRNRNWSAAWINDYEFNRPMLQLNTACEFCGSVVMFLLVHYWLRQCSGAPARQWLQPLRCAWPALFSALLVWSSPAAIFNAHSYPQWDVWILPPFLLAIYLGLLDFWLVSGICIGVVSMGKGQILMVTPVLVVWQLLMFRPGAVVRLLIGIILAIGLVASPWLAGNPAAFRWIIWVILSAVCMSLLFYLRRSSRSFLIAQAVVVVAGFGMIFWPWMTKPRPDYFAYALLTFVTIVVAARWLPRRWAPTWFSTVIAGGLFACVKLFDTSMAWYTIGIKFPTEHWQLLYWCKAMNLGAILQESFGWKFDDAITLSDYLPFYKVPSVDTLRYLILTIYALAAVSCVAVAWIKSARRVRIKTACIFVALTLTTAVMSLDRTLLYIEQFLQENQTFPMRYLMITAYLVSLFLCGIGMAIHTRRKDRMFFFAMVAPWVLMYALLPQMQNRYLLWGAVFSAATASFSLDGLMLYLLLNAVNFVDTALDMLRWSRHTKTGVKWLPLVGPLFPQLSWAVLLLAAIYLYLALRRDRSNASALATIASD